MSWSALEDEQFASTTPHHPSSPSCVGFAEQRARGCHNGLVESAAVSDDHAATRLRMATVQHPCLSSLGQQELPLDIPLNRNRKGTCAASATTACPPSFLARSSGSELAVFHSSIHAHGAAPLCRLHAERPTTTMSASFVHPKLDALPALDMESDRLARACGQGPSFSARSSFSHSHDDPRVGSWDGRPRSPERRGQRQPPASSSAPAPAPFSSSSLQPHANPPRWEYPDFSGLGLGPIPGPGPGLASPRGIRPRPHSVRVPARVSPVPPIPHRPRSFSQPASIPIFAPSSPHAVLRSLQAALERDCDDAQLLSECVDVQGVLERWTAHRRVLVHSPAGVEGLPFQRPGAGQDGATTDGMRTFGAHVSVAVKCASMSTVLGGFQHPIPWVVYACVEELNRTGIYQPGLFRAVPNRSRLEKLISLFDCALPASRLDPDFDSPCPPCVPTASSTRASLRKESMADVCALLKSYMDSLPEPLLHENLTNALHRLCVEPSDKREQEKESSTCEAEDSAGYFHLPPSISPQASVGCTHGRTRSNPVSPTAFSPLLMTPSERRSADLSLESAQVHLAQHLLRLAAPPLCSLFAYLCAFFTQLPLSPDNGIALDDVARMFGRSLAGGPAPTRNAVLMWLLERWPRVADGLFSICAGDADADEDVAAGSVFPPFAPALAPSTDAHAVQSPDRTPHIPYFAPSLAPEYDVSISGGTEARRRGSLASLDGAESVFTASTASSDDGVHGVRTPFSSEFATVPLPAVHEYEFELEWEEPQFANGLAELSSERVDGAGLSSQAMLALHAKAIVPESCTPKRPARPTATSRTSSLRRTASPHSPPPDSEYGCDSPSSSTPSAVHSRSASCASAISDVTTTTSKQRSGSPLSILKRLGFRESSPHLSAGARKKKNAAAHPRAGSDSSREPPAAASNGAVEH